MGIPKYRMKNNEQDKTNKNMLALSK